MADPKKASEILQQANVLPLGEFVAEAYNATGDGRLLSPDLSLFEKRSFAIDSLVRTIQSAGGVDAVDLFPDYRIDDHYNTLGIDKDASQSDIKNAYDEKVEKIKGELSRGDLSDKELQSLNEQYHKTRDAYFVLGDEESKEKYDEFAQQSDLRTNDAEEKFYIVNESGHTQYKNIYKEAKDKRLRIEEQEGTKTIFQEKDTRRVEIPDYYLLLDVPQNATAQEVQAAYSNKIHQLSNELEGKTLSTQELEEYNKRYSNLREAKAVLSSPEAKTQYNSIINETTPVVRPDGSIFYPYTYTKQEDVSGHLLAEFKPSQVDKSDQNRAIRNTNQFREGVNNSGFISLSEQELTKLSLETEIEDLNSDHYNAGLRLFANGGEGISEQYSNAIKELGLSPELQKELLKPAEMAKFMELGNEDLARNLRIAAGNPELKMSLVSDLSSVTKDHKLVLGTRNNKLSLLKQFIRPNKKLSQFKIDKATELVKGITDNLISKGVKKAKDKAKSIIKRGGIKKLALKLLGNVSAIFTGGLSKVAIFVATKVVPWLKRNLHKIGATILTAGLLLGSPALAIGGGAVTATGLVTSGAGLGGIATTFSGFIAFITEAATGYLGWIFGGVGAFFLLTIIIVYIINVSAYVVPVSFFTALSTQGVLVDSPYMDVTKTVLSKTSYPNPNLFDSPGETVRYRIEVTAIDGALENIRTTYECNVIQEDANPPGCPTPDPSPLPSIPDVLADGETASFEYSQFYAQGDMRYADSLVIDRFTVIADAIEQPQTREVAQASITIGNPPLSCPSIWPVNTSAIITQGRLVATGSHHSIQAIDIAPGGSGDEVVATHDGIASEFWSTCEGNVIQIQSQCGNTEFTSRYSHLEDIFVEDGQFVELGQVIGTINNTGSCTTGPHLHYQFNGLRMEHPYIPETVIPEGCCLPSLCSGTQACQTSIQ